MRIQLRIRTCEWSLWCYLYMYIIMKPYSFCQNNVTSKTLTCIFFAGFGNFLSFRQWRWASLRCSNVNELLKRWVFFHHFIRCLSNNVLSRTPSRKDGEFFFQRTLRRYLSRLKYEYTVKRTLVKRSWLLHLKPVL